MLTHSTLLATLFRHPLFQALPQPALQELALGAGSRRLLQGATLHHEGDPARHFFILVHGQIKLHRLSGDGQERVLEIVRPGDVFAETPLFDEQPHYRLSATALRETLVLQVQMPAQRLGGTVGIPVDEVRQHQIMLVEHAGLVLTGDIGAEQFIDDMGYLQGLDRRQHPQIATVMQEIAMQRRLLRREFAHIDRAAAPPQHIDLITHGTQRARIEARGTIHQRLRLQQTPHFVGLVEGTGG